MTYTRNVVIAIGNSDDKLSQAAWAEFQARVHRFVETAGERIHGRWASLPDAPWQNAAWSFDVTEDSAAEWLRGELASLADRYGQDSIAWTEGQTEFIAPAATTGADPEPPAKILYVPPSVPQGGILRRPRTWEQIHGIRIADADGWRNADLSFESVITEAHFLRLASESTVDSGRDPSVHNPWDRYCTRSVSGEPTHGTARCLVCRPTTDTPHNDPET